jgi:hypothetical protein
MRCARCWMRSAAPSRTSARPPPGRGPARVGHALVSEVDCDVSIAHRHQPPPCSCRSARVPGPAHGPPRRRTSSPASSPTVTCSPRWYARARAVVSSAAPPLDDRASATGCDLPEGAQRHVGQAEEGLGDHDHRIDRRRSRRIRRQRCRAPVGDQRGRPPRLGRSYSTRCSTRSAASGPTARSTASPSAR